jgi:hypothetical protein
VLCDYRSSGLKCRSAQEGSEDSGESAKRNLPDMSLVAGVCIRKSYNQRKEVCVISFLWSVCVSLFFLYFLSVLKRLSDQITSTHGSSELFSRVAEFLKTKGSL